MKRYGIYALACFTAILLSSELAFSLPIVGVGPDLVIVVLATFAMAEDPKTAAIAGFATGLGRDLLISSPAGLSAFAYSITAYSVALAGTARGVWTYLGLIAGATFASHALFGFGSMLLGQDMSGTPLARVVLVTTGYNSLLAPLLMPLLRKIALAERPGGAE
ncbi:MAG TPA: rod shape-determining protein MreD [Actinomycetota bacterium]|jgi:rod shape-determining protein MreD|nr:rod shape-determining protein MreD [Actinomycetota bacterium]